MLKEKDKQNLQKMLQERLENIMASVDDSNRTIDELSKTGSHDTSDIVSINLQNDLNTLILQKNQREIQEITRALEKIAQGEYGICEMCDEPIKLERLKIKPHAKFCIKCREIYEKEKLKESK